MPHLLEKRDRWGHGIAVWILAAMVLLLPPSLWLLTRMEMRNDVASWLPGDDPQAIALDEFLQMFPKKDRMLLTWDECSLGDPRIEQLAIQLEGIPDSNGVPQGGSPYIAEVLTPNRLMARMKRVGLVEQIDRLEGMLLGKGPLRLRLTESGIARGRFLIDDLKKIAAEQLKIDLQVVETKEDSSWVTPTLPEIDSVDEDNAELEDYLVTQPPYDVAVRWDGMHKDQATIDRLMQLAKAMRGRATSAEPTGALMIEDCFFHAGSHAALAVGLTEAGVEDRSLAVDVIRDTAEAVGIAPSALRLGGRLVASGQLNQSVKKAAWDPSFPVWDPIHRSPILFSFLVSVVFSFILLRSARLAILVMIVSGYTVALTMSLIPLTGAYMNMVLVVMPTLLMVLTTSAGIHLANYWRHAAQEGEGSEANFKAVIEAAKTASKPCMLASATTAIGLISLCSSSLIPVRHFGIYSAIGCIISLVVVLLGLPSLMLYWQSRSPGEAELKSDSWNHLGKLISRHNISIIATCAVVGIVCTAGLHWFKTETKVIRYFPEESRIVKDYRYIEENICGIVPVDITVRFDSEAQSQLKILERVEILRRIEKKIKDHKEISGTVSFATLQPETEVPGSDANAFQRMKYIRTSNAFESKVYRLLNKNRIGSDDRSDDEDDEESDNDNIEGLASFLAIDPGTGKGQDAKDDEVWRVSAQVAIMSDLDYADLMDDLDTIVQSELKMVGSPNTRHKVTGLVPVFLRTQQAVLESLVRSFVLAFGIIAVVMMILLKNPLAGVITMIPNLLPVFAVFGAISYFGIRIDIGTMITASVALGIAVDGTLHLLTWFKRNIEAGATRQEAVSRSLEHCGPAMLQTSAAIGLGMLTLMPVELLLISRFGWLMAALIAAALIADVILLPALLSGFLGTLIEGTLRKTPDGEDDESLPHPTVNAGDDKVTTEQLQHRVG
ncbi:MAG: RND family transporter [Planctomycetaceae bacterium]